MIVAAVFERLDKDKKGSKAGKTKATTARK
jgi:hypothetical protein